MNAYVECQLRVRRELGVEGEPAVDRIQHRGEGGQRLVPGLLDPFPAVLLDEGTSSVYPVLIRA